METARLQTKHGNRLFGSNVGPTSECDQMLLVNDPDPTFAMYTCGLNLLDRDYWNARLDQRAFLVTRPPVKHIYYPQSTNLCTFNSGCTPPILTDQTQASEEYYNTYLRPRDPNLGLPTTNNQFCSASQMCKPTAFQTPNAENGINWSDGKKIPTVYGVDNLSELRRSGGPAGRQAIKNMYDHCSQMYPLADYSPAVGGVNYNVESESALRRLDHYCPSDVADSRVSTAISSDNLGQAKVYHPECVQPLPGIETPFVWRNLTKIRNRYQLEDVPSSANLSNCS